MQQDTAPLICFIVLFFIIIIDIGLAMIASGLV